MSLALAAAAALLMQPAPQAGGPSAKAVHDSLLGGLVEVRQPDLGEMHTLVRSEPRDEVWAGKTEAALRAAYEGLPAMGETARALRIVCASSLCEVAGIILPTSGDVDQQYKSIQDPAIMDATKTLGLETVNNAFGSAPDGSKRSVFVAYWTRKKG